MAKKEECLQCSKIRRSSYGIKCSYFGRQPDFDESVCPHYDGIQASQVVADVRDEIHNTNSKEETQVERRCPYCGEVIANVAIKCKHCGEWLSDDKGAIQHNAVANEPKQKGYILGALAGGIVAGIICTLLWVKIVELIDYEHSYYALAVGAIVGFSVRWVGRGETLLFGVIAAICSVVSCFLGEYLSWVDIDFYSVIFYIVAAVEGYSIAINKKDDDE